MERTGGLQRRFQTSSGVPGRLSGFQEDSEMFQVVSTNLKGVSWDFRWFQGRWIRSNGRFRGFQRVPGTFQVSSRDFKGYHKFSRAFQEASALPGNIQGKGLQGPLKKVSRGLQ